VMTERVFIGVRGELRLSRRAAREEHEHEVVPAGRVLSAWKPAGKTLELLVEIVPAVALSATRIFVRLPA
jgi:hypothetical protein